MSECECECESEVGDAICGEEAARYCSGDCTCWSDGSDSLRALLVVGGRAPAGSGLSSEERVKDMSFLDQCRCCISRVPRIVVPATEGWRGSCRGKVESGGWRVNVNEDELGVPDTRRWRG